MDHNQPPMTFWIILHRTADAAPTDPPSHGFGPFESAEQAREFSADMGSDACDTTMCPIYLVLDMRADAGPPKAVRTLMAMSENANKGNKDLLN